MRYSDQHLLQNCDAFTPQRADVAPLHLMLLQSYTAFSFSFVFVLSHFLTTPGLDVVKPDSPGADSLDRNVR